MVRRAGAGCFHLEFAGVRDHYAGMDSAYGEFAAGPVLWQESADFKGDYSLCPQVSWLLFRLGNGLYLLVSFHDQHKWAFVWLHIYMFFLFLQGSLFLPACM
jgi:hypothetical protein